MAIPLLTPHAGVMYINTNYIHLSDELIQVVYHRRSTFEQMYFPNWSRMFDADNSEFLIITFLSVCDNVNEVNFRND